ncbi:MAG TPA: hypothetical protein VEZ42_13665 [Pseudonocardia sp.]|nr:hypothetical protein [Pseudonocardia sp.]
MSRTSEPDVGPDDHLARTRETGGVEPNREDGSAQRAADSERSDPDGGGTTGTDENEEFVGRVAGQDAGYAGETGAEARSEAAREE